MQVRTIFYLTTMVRNMQVLSLITKSDFVKYLGLIESKSIGALANCHYGKGIIKKIIG